MRAGGGKQKGSSFERAICKELSLWVSGGEEEDLFWRSAMSGGRATVAAKRGRAVRQYGDITAVSARGNWLTDNFIIECKAYNKLGMDNLIFYRKGLLATFVRRLSILAETSGVSYSFMLIFKENRKPPMILLGRLCYEHEALMGGVKNHVTFSLKAGRSDVRLYVATLDAFLSRVPYTKWKIPLSLC